MGYKVIGETEQLFKGYSKIKGLEGPFLKGCNTILYYDSSEGKYWNPKNDFYMTDEEMSYLDKELLRMLAR